MAPTTLRRGERQPQPGPPAVGIAPARGPRWGTRRPQDAPRCGPQGPRLPFADGGFLPLDPGGELGDPAAGFLLLPRPGVEPVLTPPAGGLAAAPPTLRRA